MSTYPIYRASRGGQDVYVQDVEASSATMALELFAEANGVEGVREIHGDQRRIQTAGVLYFYAWRAG